MRIAIFILALTTIFSSSCTDKEDLAVFEDDYLAFGTFHGHCFGNCTHFFLIEDEKIYEDDIEIGIPDELTFLTEPLGSDKYDIASELLSTFPQDLLKTDKRTFGCPDCADQGGVMLERRVDGETTRWFIDTGDDDQTQQIISYKDRVLEIVEELQ